MNNGLNLDVLPQYEMSSFRYFEKGERHVTRICREDVLVMVFDGVLRFYEDGQLIEVSKGQYYVQRKGLLQEGSVESDVPQYYYIHFTGTFGGDKHTLALLGDADISDLYPLFQQLDLLQHAGADAVSCNGVFYRILSVLNRGFANTERQKLVMKVISLATQDVQKPFSLTEIARECGYSKNHIINIFKKETGQTPYVYIANLKLTMARNLLRNSEQSVTQISAVCGFGNYINFYKEFIKAEGCSPKVWRSRQRHTDGG